MGKKVTEGINHEKVILHVGEIKNHVRKMVLEIQLNEMQIHTWNVAKTSKNNRIRTTLIREPWKFLRSSSLLSYKTVHQEDVSVINGCTRIGGKWTVKVQFAAKNKMILVAFHASEFSFNRLATLILTGRF